MKITAIDRLRTVPVHKDDEVWEVGLVELPIPGAPQPTGLALADGREPDKRAPGQKVLSAICISTTREGAALVEPDTLQKPGQPCVTPLPDDEFLLRAIAACSLDPHAPGLRAWNYLPSRIHVGTVPPAMKHALDEFFAPLGVLVEVKPELPRVRQMQETIVQTQKVQAERGDAPPVPSLMESPGMTVPRIRAFAEAARLFWNARPWEHDALDTSLWEIQPPPPWPELSHCVLLGNEEEFIGVGFYSSRAAFIESTSAAVRHGPDAAHQIMGTRWAVAIDPVDLAPPEDTLLWERESLPTAGKERRIGVPFGCSPDMRFVRPSPDQLTHMEAVLRAFAGAAPRSISEGFAQKTVAAFSGPRAVALAAIEWTDAELDTLDALDGDADPEHLVFDRADGDAAILEFLAHLPDSPETRKLRKALLESPPANKPANKPASKPVKSPPPTKSRGGRQWVYVGPEKATAVYELKITIENSNPPIWRRLLVRDDTMLDELHDAIQTAFGWTNSHLHGFRLTPQKATVPRSVKLSPEARGARAAMERARERFFSAGDDGMNEPTRGVQLDSLHLTPKSDFQYTYDYGDDWKHDIKLEKVLTVAEAEAAISANPHASTIWKRFTKATRTPVAVCIAGQRSGPLEDSGGIWRYAEVCEILADPKHPEHDEIKEWTDEYGAEYLRGTFDPEHIDLTAINKRLCKRLKRC